MIQSSARVLKEEIAKLSSELGEINVKLKALGVLIPPHPGNGQKGISGAPLH